MVKIGEAVGDFEGEATGGDKVRLSALRGKSVVLYFYPKDSTPGCTREGEDFRDLKPEFDAAGCVIFGVSRDSLKSHEKFKQKHDFDFELISDPDENLCRQFDVIREKNMYGRKVMGVERSTFLIDRDGVLRGQWRKVRVPGHAEAVLQAARELA